MGNVSNPDRARNGRREGLEMRNFARCFRCLVFLAGNDTNGMPKATNIDEPQANGEEERAGNEPYHDEGQFRLADGNRIEYEIDHRGRYRPECFIDGLVDVRKTGWRPAKEREQEWKSQGGQLASHHCDR